MEPVTMSGLRLRVGGALLVFAVDGVTDELEEEGDVVGAALVADALGPGVLVVVDVRLFVGRVVEEDLDAVGAGFLRDGGRSTDRAGRADGRAGRQS
jgi:hypothetical protein